MIDTLPKKFVKREELNLWVYDKILDKYPLVKSYLGEKIKSWIKNLSNPFVIPWMKDLHKDKLGKLEKNLMHLERRISSLNLKQIFEELPIKSKEPIEIVRKIKSLAGEINVFGYLKEKKGFDKVVKINKYGDLKCDDKIIVSVKRKESISAPYEYVENIIKALAYVEENEIIRKYNKISLSKLDKLGYRHLNLIYKYLRNYLVKDLIESDKKLKNGTYCEETKSVSIDKEHDLQLKIGGNLGSLDTIEIMLSLNNTRNVEISFNSRFPSLNVFSFSTDKDAFFEGEKIEVEVKEYIKKYIEDKINEVCRKEKPPDILWIDILLHPRYEETIKMASEQVYFRDIINSERCLEVKTILSFTFSYYSILFAESVILESE